MENEPFVYVRIKEVQRQKGKRDGSTTVAHKKSPSFAPLHTVSGNSRRKARIKNRKKSMGVPPKLYWYNACIIFSNMPHTRRKKEWSDVFICNCDRFYSNFAESIY